MEARHAFSCLNRRTALVVITAEGPPRGRPTRLRQPGPSPYPGLVMKETLSGRRSFLCSRRTTKRCAREAISHAPPEPGRRIVPVAVGDLPRLFADLDRQD